MVVVSLLTKAEFGRNDLGEDASHLTGLFCTGFSMPSSIMELGLVGGSVTGAYNLYDMKILLMTILNVN